jgi:hypothetical protein
MMTRRTTILLSALAVILAAGYTLHWQRLAHEIETRFGAWREEQQKGGITVQGEVERSGFPFSVTLNIRNFAYDQPQHVRISAPRLEVRVRPWTPFRVTSIAEENCQITFYKMNTSLGVQNLTLSLARPLFPPKSIKDNGFFITAHMSAISIDEKQKMALGNLVQELGFRAKIKGEPPEWDKKESIAAWRDNGGIAELDNLRLVWGSLNVNGKGTLALDKNLQPVASFSTSMDGYEQAIDVLREQGQIQPLAGSLIKAALKMLEDPKADPAAPKTIKVPVTVQDNALSVVGVKITQWEPYPVE